MFGLLSTPLSWKMGISKNRDFSLGRQTQHPYAFPEDINPQATTALGKRRIGDIQTESIGPSGRTDGHGMRAQEEGDKDGEASSDQSGGEQERETSEETSERLDNSPCSLWRFRMPSHACKSLVARLMKTRTRHWHHS